MIQSSSNSEVRKCRCNPLNLSPHVPDKNIQCTNSFYNGENGNYKIGFFPEFDGIKKQAHENKREVKETMERSMDGAFSWVPWKEMVTFRYIWTQLSVCMETGYKRATNTNLTIGRKYGKWLSTQAWHQPAWVWIPTLRVTICNLRKLITYIDYGED